jgi:hypothetical protein
VIDRHVVAEPRPTQRCGKFLTDRSEGVGEEAACTLERVERPEGVDDPDPEPRRQERTVAAAPQSILGLVATQPRDVVAAVVMHDEELSAWSENPFGSRELRGDDAAEPGPGRDDGVGLAVGQPPLGHIFGFGCLDRRQSRSSLCQPTGLERTATDEDDVAGGQWPECLERSCNLAFDVQGPRERVAERGFQGEGEIGHRPGSIGLIDLAATARSGSVAGGPDDADGPWRERAGRATIVAMLETVRRMPAGIRIFLFYAIAILAGIGISLRYVVDQAIGAPVSGTGVVVMVLLAYTIFTTTLVLQRKEAARTLAIVLASLTLPLIPFLLVNGLLPQGLVLTAFAAALLHGLLRPSVRAWLNEP